MGKKKKAETKAGGEQPYLIDVLPKEAKAVVREARRYKELQSARLAALSKETAQKQKVLELVKAMKLQPLKDGKVRFEHDGVLVSVEPRDELIKVKDKTESE